MMAACWLLLGLACVLEGRRAPLPGQITLSVQPPREVVRTRPFTVVLTLRNQGEATLSGVLTLDSTLGLPSSLPFTLAPGERLTEALTGVSERRGLAELGEARVQALGAWHLLERRGPVTALGRLKTWPLPGPAEALGAPGRGLGELPGGRGSGPADPGRLVPWEPGMPATDIAWRVVARSGTLVARARTSQRARRLVLAVDLGRRGRAPWGPHGTWLDSAVERALSLARTALAQGDEVGLIGFSGELVHGLAPRARALEVLWGLLGPAQPQAAAGDPRVIARTLAGWGGRPGRLLVLTPPPPDPERWQEAVRLAPDWQWSWVELPPPELGALQRGEDPWLAAAATALLSGIDDAVAEADLRA